MSLTTSLQRPAAETVDTVWIRPREALVRNDAGDFGLMAVTRRQLETLADFTGVNALESAMLCRSEYPIFRPHLPVAAES